MAKIEMDMSEYEAMKKVETLLEQALGREKEQNAVIAELNKEKIELLTSNEKVVTVVHTKNTSETKATYLDTETIIRRIQQHTEMHRDSHMMRSQDVMNDTSYMHKLFDTFFETHVHEFETSKTVTRQGLDEVTIEIRKELKAELSEEVDRELSALKHLRENKGQWAKELRIAREYGRIKDTEAEDLSKQLEKCRENNLALVDEVGGLEFGIDTFETLLINQPIGLFTHAKGLKTKLLKAIKQRENEKK
jgi:hypothetical protein